MIYQVDLCPDAQSPEISTACPPDLDLIGPVDRFNPPDMLPFTGTAWFWLLVGIAIGALIVGLLILWFNRKRKDETVAEVKARLAADIDETKALIGAELVPIFDRLARALSKIGKGD